MKLTIEQRERLKLEHGICVDEACDRCGQVLGELRFITYGQPGEWCSRECRDGIAAAQHWDATRKVGKSTEGNHRKRRADAKHSSRAARQAAYRARRGKNILAERNVTDIRPQAADSKGQILAQSGSQAHRTRRPVVTDITAQAGMD